jgi:hypothetical protein
MQFSADVDKPFTRDQPPCMCSTGASYSKIVVFGQATPAFELEGDAFCSRGRQLVIPSNILDL